MQWLAMALCLAWVGCASVANPADVAETSTVVITFVDMAGSDAWPSATATFAGRASAMCPVTIVVDGLADDLHCDYPIGPLPVPETFDVRVRGDADSVEVSSTETEITADASWGADHVSYRLDIVRGAMAPPDPNAASDVLRVTCDGKRTTTATPIVEAQDGGISYEVDAAPDVRGLMFHHIAWEHGTAVGADTDGKWPSPIEPGLIVVACLPTNRASYWDVEFATFELIDPNGLWIEDGIDCPETTSSEGGVSPWPLMVSHLRLDEELRPDVSGLQVDDVLRPVGYPDSPGMKTALWNGLVVREGERVARVTLDFDGAMAVEACVGSGIAARSD